MPPASRSRPTPGRRSTTSRASSPAGGWRPRRRPGVPNYIDPMVANEAQHDTGAKMLLNGVVLPRGAEHDEGSGRRDRQHLQRPERRAVHREAADSAPGHEQSEPGLRRPRGRGVQRQRRRRRAATCGGGRERSCSTPRRAATARRDAELRPPAASGAVHRQPAARVRRHARRTGTRRATATSIRRACRWGWTCSVRRRCSATSRPRTVVPGTPRRARARSSGCSRRRPRCGGSTS